MRGDEPLLWGMRIMIKEFRVKGQGRFFGAFDPRPLNSAHLLHWLALADFVSRLRTKTGSTSTLWRGGRIPSSKMVVFIGA